MRYTPEEKVYSMINKIEAYLSDLRTSLDKAFKGPIEKQVKDVKAKPKTKTKTKTKK